MYYMAACGAVKGSLWVGERLRAEGYRPQPHARHVCRSKLCILETAARGLGPVSLAVSSPLGSLTKGGMGKRRDTGDGELA